MHVFHTWNLGKLRIDSKTWKENNIVIRDSIDP